MSHTDSIYSAGIRRLPVWVALKDVIQGLFIKDGKPAIKFPGGLRTRGEEPNLDSLVQEMLEPNERVEALWQKYSLLNKALLENIDAFKGREIIFTDPVSPDRLEGGKFLFPYMKALNLAFEQPENDDGKPSPVWHDPYSPSFAQFDAVLLMAARNPPPWSKKIIWPVSFVALPSEVVCESEISLSYVFPEVFDSIDAQIIEEGRVGLGSRMKRLSDIDPFNESKVGTFECNPSSFDAKGLEYLLTFDPKIFDSRIEKIMKKRNLSREQAVQFVKAEIPYDVFLKREMTALFYARILDALDLNPVLFAPKSSASYAILDRAVKILKRMGKDRKIDPVGPDESGPLDTSKKSPFGYLESSALERLNGFVINPEIARGYKEKKPPAVEFRKEKPGISLHACPYAPVLCEAVYPEKGSCARDEKQVDSCSLDLFERIKNPNFLRSWVEHYNSQHPDSPIKNLAEFVDRESKRLRFRFYSAEQVAWLLNEGRNYEVFTSTDFLDGELMSEDDARRRKGRSSWRAEKGIDKIFPFIHEDFIAKNAFGRISSFNSKCDLARLIAMHREIPPDVPSSEPAVFGTCAHLLTNGHIPGDFMLQERLWKRFGLHPAKRGDYTEKAVKLTIDGEELSGHPDCSLIKAPMQGRELKGQTVDLVVVDYKISVHTPYPRKRHILQVGSYAVSYSQLFPEVNFKNFYIVLLCRPLVSSYASQEFYRQRLSIIKIENKSGDLLFDEIKAEHAKTVARQKEILSSPAALRAHKGEMLGRGACEKPVDNFSKAGCFDEERLKCECLFKNLSGSENLKAYFDRMRE